jgi:hypothetical protein
MPESEREAKDKKHRTKNRIEIPLDRNYYSFKGKDRKVSFIVFAQKSGLFKENFCSFP